MSNRFPNFGLRYNVYIRTGMDTRLLGIINFHMKKTIQKPDNWQDFEALCKKLWGEIWNIPNKIKINGRQGQKQAGVDIYGIPKGEQKYWGIQCKGKDENVNAKLNKIEIDKEISKARTFRPNLKVFIFATTMSKDSALEEYIREKDLESRANGEFEILLYCWEDIADLIDDNRETYNYYVANQKHKSNYNFIVSFEQANKKIVINPKCIRIIKQFRLKSLNSINLNTNHFNYSGDPTWMVRQRYYKNNGLTNFLSGKVNEAICSIKILMKNVGSEVIEDWRLSITIDGEYQELKDVLGTGPMGMIDFEMLNNKNTSIEKNHVTYYPRDNSPLIQSDKLSFQFFIIPQCKQYTIPVTWHLMARNYNSKGKLELLVEPEYEDLFVTEYVDNKNNLHEDQILSVEAKKNYSNDDK